MHGSTCASEVAELLLRCIFVYNNFYCLNNKKIKFHHTIKFWVMNWGHEKATPFHTFTYAMYKMSLNLLR